MIEVVQTSAAVRTEVRVVDLAVDLSDDDVARHRGHLHGITIEDEPLLAVSTDLAAV